MKLARSLKKNPELVAIKIVNRQKAPQDFLQRFLPRELEIWPKLDHPHIIKFCRSFEESEHVYIVLEYASNGDMLKYVQNYGPIPERRNKILVRQVS